MADDGKKPAWMAETKLAPDGLPAHQPPPPAHTPEPGGWGSVGQAPPLPPPPQQPGGWGAAANPSPGGWGQPAPPQPPPAPNPWAAPPPQQSPPQLQPGPSPFAQPQPVPAPRVWQETPVVSLPPSNAGWWVGGGFFAVAAVNLLQMLMASSMSADTLFAIVRVSGALHAIAGGVLVFGFARLGAARSGPARIAAYAAATSAFGYLMATATFALDPMHMIGGAGAASAWLIRGAILGGLVAVGLARRGQKLSGLLIGAFAVFALDFLQLLIFMMAQTDARTMRTLVTAATLVLAGLAVALVAPGAGAPGAGRPLAAGPVLATGGGRVELGRYVNLLYAAIPVTLCEILFFAVGFGTSSEGAAIACAFIASAALAVWAFLAARNTRALGAAQLRFTPAIAFLTQMLPLANIIAGSYVFQELWQRSYGATTQPPSRLVKVTFRLIVWGLLANLLFSMLIVGSIGARGEMPNPAVFLPIHLARLVVASGFVMRVVACFRISARQADAFRRLSVQA